VNVGDPPAEITDSGVWSSVGDSQRAARRIVAVGGGKGGSGKSLLAANVAIFLATLGKRVVLFDADLGGANLHTFVGVDRPAVSLVDVFEKRVSSVEGAVVETPIPGLGLISGEGDPSWMANPRPAQRTRLLNQMQELVVDYLVVDLGPGTASSALDFFLLADLGIVVVVPEPTSIENAYRFVKCAFVRRLRRAGLERVLALVGESSHAFEGGIPTPMDLYQAARAAEPELATRMLVTMQAFRPRVVVNQARGKSDQDLGPAIASAARRRLGVPMEYLGVLEQDDAVWLAVRKRRPLVIEAPESRAAKCIERVARRLINFETEKPAPFQLRNLDDLSHYDILEIDPSATDEEIRRAYRRVREVYGVDSMVVAGLYGKERLAAMHVRIDEAYETLIDEERRRAYDLELFPDEQLPRRRVVAPVAVDRPERTGPVMAVAPAVEEVFASASPAAPRMLPPEPDVGPSTEFTGFLLRQIREARGIDLHAIAQRTKITVAHLRALEEETVKTMPAQVYVRGFLVEYARILGLDALRVKDTYLERYRAGRGLPVDAARDDGVGRKKSKTEPGE
jgi:flagellar biosynthesis protein FlhG